MTALDPALPTLAETLREHGFATAALVNNPFMDPSYGMARGFDRYDHAPGDNVRLRRADEMVDLALRWLDEHHGRDLFLLLHLFDPHMNYDAPPPHRGRFTSQVPGDWELPVSDWKRIRAEAPNLSDAERQFVAAAYDEEIAFLDEQVGRFLAELERRGILRDGLVVLTSDHGEELFEHDGFEHGHAFWQELLWIPLVFWGRDVRPGSEEAPVSLVDVAPTVLQAIGLAPPKDVEGLSLWPTLRLDAAVPERTLYAEAPLYGPFRVAALRWPLKLELEEETGRRRVFDLGSDPLESRLAGGDHPAKTAALLRDTRQHFSTLSPRGKPVLVTPQGQLERHLRALGYLD
jgi:arylsulfatase A-like enzyme